MCACASVRKGLETMRFQKIKRKMIQSNCQKTRPYRRFQMIKMNQSILLVVTRTELL